MESYASVIDVVSPGAQRQPSERELRELFGKCGRILSIHPWRGNHSEKLHYFIVFENESAIRDSLTSFRGTFHVSSLRNDPTLRDKYLAVLAATANRPVPSAPRAPTRYRSVSRGSYHHRSMSRGRDIPISRNRSYRRDTRQDDIPIFSQPQTTPQSSSTPLPPLRWTDASNEGGHFMPASIPHAYIPSQSSHRSSISNGADSTWSSRLVNSSSSSAEPISPVSVKQEIPFMQSTSDSPIEVDTTVIEWTMKGKSLATPSFDLKRDLPEKVEYAVELLRVTGEKADWLIVAANYRRNKDLRSAEQIMAGFIEWMTERGDEHDLKPAFLFLSSLHADIAKSAAVGLTASEALRSAAVTNSQRTAAHYISIAHGMDGSAFRSLKRFVAHHDKEFEKENIDPRSSSPPLPSLPSGIHSTATRPDSLRKQHQFSHSYSPQTASSSSQIETATLRLAKRRLEEEASEERNVRRKLEKTMEELQEELRRKSALLEFKQSQVKMEIDCRRVAELELQKFKSYAKEKEDEVRKETSRKTLLSIASQLTAAANTQTDDCSFFFAK